jgi:hypothetical protein
VTTGAMQQPAGKQEANWNGGISKQEVVECQEDERQRRHDKRHCDNQPENERQKGGRRQHTKRRRCLEKLVAPQDDKR